MILLRDEYRSFYIFIASFIVILVLLNNLDDESATSTSQYYYQTEITQVIEEEIKEENMESADEEIEWNFMENTVIGGCCKDNCEEIETLERAKKECVGMGLDCMGVTLENGKYTLRRGPKLLRMDITGLPADEVPVKRAWAKWTVDDCTMEDYIRDHGENIVLNLTDFIEENPTIKNRLGRPNTEKCEFMFGYSHIGKLLQFNKDQQINVLQRPEDCSFSSDSSSILFGIKTLPGASEFRQAIRETWLSPGIWKWLGYQLKVVFLIGNPTGVDLAEEIERHNDLLILDIEESHYNLPFKDVAFLRFIKNRCQADFIFKGDDDICLVPQNLVTEIERMKNTPGIGSFGCLKGPEPVTRIPFFKYFVPRQIYGPEEYPEYFSGAGYVTTLEFALKLEEQTYNVPVIPLDDTYVGTLIQAANLSDSMMRSLTSCMGLVPRIFRKEKASNDLCTLRGFNFVHKYRDPNRMKYVYHDLVSAKFSCNISAMEEYWKPTSGWRRVNFTTLENAWHENFERFRPYLE